MHVFIDTEFTSLAAPKLPSIGLAASDGRECYVELGIAPALLMQPALCVVAQTGNQGDLRVAP